ncbi:methylated-DNA--[protein]-cysteine S-methyltransferase [Candidatus Peregrinibacteria bacterium]|nr:methylated-DNA--[protein]-cysteine S-methyltransferase [Candidatus Peregrinibacteria bacterium]
MRKDFSFPLDLGGTPFQKAVWKEVAKIPYGETRSYKQVAQAIRRPTAFRAVAQSIGANPVAIIIPCHRVVASPGSTQPLGGYAWGVDLKKRLLDHERTHR